MNPTNENQINPNVKAKILTDFNNILDEGRLSPNQKTDITHVSLGGNRGKFSFNKSQRKRLNKIVSKAVAAGIDIHLAEMPKEYGPILIDIDLNKKKEDYNISKNNGRLYDNDMIIEVVDYYREAIKKYLDVSNNQLMVAVMEKNAVNIRDNEIRDGFHACFYQVCTSAKLRYLIRDYVVNKAKQSEYKTFDNFEKSVEHIFDKQIVNTNAWLMYGCKKPEGNKYVLTKMLDVDFKDYGTNFKNDVFNFEDNYERVKIFSIQQKNWNYENSCPYNGDYTEDLINQEFEGLGFIKKSIQIQPTEDLPEHKKINIEKAKVLLTMLNPKRADNYLDWMRVGWALHNVDKSLLYDWIEFSQQSDKYKEGECDERWMGMKNQGLTISSLIYWAKEDNPEEYKRYQKQSYDYFLKNCTDGNTYYIAKALQNKYADRFVCVSRTKNIWYEFRNHRWSLSEGGVGLTNLICTDFINDFHQMVIDYNQKAMDAKGSEKEDFQNKASRTQKAIDRLLNITFKKQIMEESRDLFYDNEFIKKLDDVNKNLIAFENGVYDLEKGEFRPGRADDFISLSTKVNYIQWDVRNNEIRKYKEKLDNYFNQVLPDPEKRKYFLLSIATSCSGENKEQKFRTITGSGIINNGSNGKSLTMSLVAKAFGDYYVACPVTIITRKRGDAGQASPELARLKGVRIGVFQETDESDSLNTGVVKELTGNDRFMVRPLYQEPFEMQLQAKFWLQCNKLPAIKAQDRGIWRRVKVIEFSSVFVDHPDPSKPNEFQLNSSLEYEIDNWAPYFMSWLINLYINDYKKNLPLLEPESVQAFTEKYKSESNSVLRFITAVIEIDNTLNKYTSLNTCWDRYKDWVREQNDDAIKCVSKTEFDKMFIEQTPAKYNADKSSFRNIKFRAVPIGDEESEDDGDKNKKSLDL
jgi:P4 family phage/plasmid primase-like protien